MMSLISSQKVPLVSMFTCDRSMHTYIIVGVEFATKNIKIVSVYDNKKNDSINIYILIETIG
jgi:hypothetical protein